METSPQGISLLAKAFSKAQGKFRIPVLNREVDVKKDGRLLYKTKYADIQEIIDCIRGPLAENDLCFIQSTQEIENKWFLVLELLHSSGESRKSFLPLNVNQPNQQLGGTLTYLKRYQLSAFFGLAADFDDDGNATTGNQATFTEKKKPLGPPLIKPRETPLPIPPENDVQSFPEDDLDQALGQDPADFILTIGSPDNRGKPLRQIPASTLRVIFEWAETEMKKTPVPSNIDQIAEIHRNVFDFLRSVNEI